MPWLADLESHGQTNEATPGTAITLQVQKKVGELFVMIFCTNNVWAVSGPTNDHTLALDGLTIPKIAEVTHTDGMASDGVTLSAWGALAQANRTVTIDGTTAQSVASRSLSAFRVGDGFQGATILEAFGQAEGADAYPIVAADPGIVQEFWFSALGRAAALAESWTGDPYFPSAVYTQGTDGGGADISAIVQAGIQQRSRMWYGPHLSVVRPWAGIACGLRLDTGSALWEAWILQDGVESEAATGAGTRYGTEQQARDWLSFKRAEHVAAGWTILSENAESFDAERVYPDAPTKRRQIGIRAVV